MEKSTRIAPLLLLFVLATAHAQGIFSNGNTCPDQCPDVGRPVCGTNNILYKNECLLRAAACRNNNIRKQNDGPCVGTSKKDCNRNCPSGYRPFCATNGRTYDNRCKLNVAICKHSNIELRYEGVCDISAGSSSSSPSNSVASIGNPVLRPSGQVNNVGSSSSSSSGFRPSVGSVAIGAPVSIFPASTQSNNTPRPRPPVAAPPAQVVNTPRPVRNCPDNCNPGFRPVCGTDGQVYGSECKIRVAICKNSNLQKRNDGVCEKDCSIQCPTEISYVCGSDGKTYLNDCELTVARCKDPAIRKHSNGACAVFRDTECNVDSCTRTFTPVCGSDGRTYENMCLLMRRACVNKSLLRLHDGACGVQECATECPQVLDPVCGSDGVTYPSHCALINTACRNRSDLLKIADGACRRF